MTPTVTIDAKQVLARFSPAGIPQGVRQELRAVLPDLTRRLGLNVEERLNTQLRSRRRLKVDKLLREDARGITGQVRTVWTGDKSKSFIPQILETGAKAHPIFPRNAKALSFFWERIGQRVVLASVWHPGFPGINYMTEAFREMEGEILGSITEAVRRGLRRAA